MGELTFQNRNVVTNVFAGVIFLMSFLSSSAMAAEPSTTQEQSAQAYVIAQAQIADWNEFQRYQEAALPSILAHKGKAIVATKTVAILEGRWAANWTVVLEFPSMQAAKDWYASQSYQQAIPIRKKATKFTNLLIVDKYSPK